MPMKTVAALLLACSVAGPVLAQTPDQRLGDHPAVVVQRLQAQRGYDYLSQFYPHPAWLYLIAEPPQPVTQAPTVLAGAPHPNTGAHHERRH